MKKVANSNALVLERFSGFIFDAALVSMAFLAFQPLVELVGNAPNTMVAISPQPTALRQDLLFWLFLVG